MICSDFPFFTNEHGDTERWFHPGCIGIDLTKVSENQLWFCPPCAMKRKRGAHGKPRIMRAVAPAVRWVRVMSE